LPEANLLPAAHTQLINKSREDEIGLNKDYCGARINVCSVKEYVCVYTSGCCCSRGGCINNFTLFSDFVQLQKATRLNAGCDDNKAAAASACDFLLLHRCEIYVGFVTDSSKIVRTQHDFCWSFLTFCVRQATLLLTNKIKLNPTLSKREREG